MCGGTRPSVRFTASIRGLSPRVRGNRWCTMPSPTFYRSIPACAGEPHTRLGAALRSGVYPRVCGGTPLRRGQRPDADGLSPRVRGNPDCKDPLEVSKWSIPACAGEPPTNDVILTPSTVYPRVCGGTRGRVALLKILQGLSPRVRGNPWRFDSDPRYLIRQGNNAAPIGGTIPPARPPCPALFVATFGLRRRVIRLLNCGVRPASGRLAATPAASAPAIRECRLPPRRKPPGQPAAKT